MKKILTIAALAFSTAAFAQQGFIGPKIGINLTSLTNTKVPDGDTKDTYKSVITPTIGFVINNKIKDYLAFRPEVLYTQRGAQVKGFEASGNEVFNKMTLHYLEIPLNIVGQYKLGPGNAELFLGPSLGFCLGGKYKTSDKTYKVEPVDQPNPTDQVNMDKIYVNPFNFSINAGLGYSLNHWVFQVQYNYGFSNVTAHPEVKDQDRIDARKKDVIKSSSISLGVVYLFGGGASQEVKK